MHLCKRSASLCTTSWFAWKKRINATTRHLTCNKYAVLDFNVSGCRYLQKIWEVKWQNELWCFMMFSFSAGQTSGDFCNSAGTSLLLKQTNYEFSSSNLKQNKIVMIYKSYDKIFCGTQGCMKRRTMWSDEGWGSRTGKNFNLYCHLWLLLSFECSQSVDSARMLVDMQTL